MPAVTRKEFAELCGDRLDAINVWIKRKKIWVLPDNKKLIDTENPINDAFMRERQLFNQAKQMGEALPKTAKQPKIAVENIEKSPAEPEKKRGRPKKGAESAPKQPKKSEKQPVKVVEKRVSPAEIQKKERVIADHNVLAKQRMDQDMQKKALEIENLELAKQQKQLMLNKAAGKLLDVDLVKGVLTRHANSIFKSFEKGCENIAAIFAGSDQQLFVGIMKDLKPELSRCVKEAGVKADEEVEILVAEFSETLARGQRKI